MKGLSNYCQTFLFFPTKDLRKEQDILCLPVYMTALMAEE